MFPVDDKQLERLPELATNDYWRSTMRRARLDRGLTQGQLADEVGVSQPLISGIESGAIRQSKAVLAVCHALNIPRPDDVHTDEEEQRWVEAGRALRARNADQFTAMLTTVEQLIAHSGDRKQ